MDDVPKAEHLPQPDICDLCHQAIATGTGMYAMVPDSSAIHPSDAELDGRRIVSACGPEHLGELQQLYHDRPFVNEELWTAKIDRALAQHPEGLSPLRLAETTGLNLLQVEKAAFWALRASGHERSQSKKVPPGPGP
jgi:hypothetical protein